MNWLLGCLRVLTTPSCWVQNNQYSSQWDRHLSFLLKHSRFEDVGLHTARIGGITVWISNHPYSSFSPYKEDLPEVRPKRITMLRAYDELMKDGLKWQMGATGTRSDVYDRM